MNPTLSSTGSAWCAAALDPFHDYTQYVPGLPDGSTTSSYVRVYNQTLTVGATANGDVIRIQFDGLHHYPTAADVNQTVSHLVPTTSVDFTANTSAFGPITVLRATAAQAGVNGNVGFYQQRTGSATLLGYLNLSFDNQTPHRMIAMGMEVHDITPPLNQSGSIAIATIPGRVQKSAKFLEAKLNSGDFKELSFGNSVLTASMPTSRQLASTIPGYLEWESKKGCYIAATMIHPPEIRHFTSVQGVDGLVVPSQQSLGIVEEALFATGQATWTYLNVNPLSVGAALNLSSPSFDSGFQPYQIWLSSLNSTSTFKIVLRTIVEFFPEVSDGATIANAVFPTPMDLPALTEYSKRRAVSPVAVPVSLNAKGDWWRMVLAAGKLGLKAALAALPAPLSTIGQPLAAAAMGIAESLSKSGAPRAPSRRKRNRHRGPPSGTVVALPPPPRRPAPRPPRP